MNAPTKPNFGRGHWPAGKRRNAGVRPPKGYSSIPEFLAAVRAACETRRGARADLASCLKVHHETVSTWLTEEKWPNQARVNQIAAWFRKTKKAKR